MACINGDVVLWRARARGAGPGQRAATPPEPGEVAPRESSRGRSACRHCAYPAAAVTVTVQNQHLAGAGVPSARSTFFSESPLDIYRTPLNLIDIINHDPNIDTKPPTLDRDQSSYLH
jgi:hypothetical protein